MLSLYGLLDKAIRKGRLTVVDAKGITREFGGTEPGPEAAIRFTSSTAPLKILINPELKAAEAFMDGHLVVDRGSIHDLIQVFYANKRHFDLRPARSSGAGCPEGSAGSSRTMLCRAHAPM
jgi:cyclopropane-fatty-acyl-phospholipid synthase